MNRLTDTSWHVLWRSATCAEIGFSVQGLVLAFMEPLSVRLQLRRYALPLEVALSDYSSQLQTARVVNYACISVHLEDSLLATPR